MIAATGDWLTRAPLPSPATDRGFAGVIDVVRSASLGLTTLEENLLDEKKIPPLDASGTVRWPYGTKSTADDLRRVGMTVVSLANNHAIDYGAEGMGQTKQILDREGLRIVGIGESLDQAQAPVFLGTSPRRVAIIAVSTSASAESRATHSRGEILGRPGVNVLRYSPDVTVDPATFAILQRSPIATASGNHDQLTLSGTTIKKGAHTKVEFVPNNDDLREILAQVRLARSESDEAIVMLHSHEPDNQSSAPADFVQSFARALIDAGASIVVGTGPHRLRGIELYKSGAIFYSLGNFTFDYSAIDRRSADVYESGADLYQLALGALGSASNFAVPQSSESIWWQSVIALTTLDRGALKSIRLRPIDLGTDMPPARRGIPIIASAQRAGEILQRLADLSRACGTEILIRNGQGEVQLDKSR